MRPDIRLQRPLSLSLRLTLLFGIAAAGIFIIFGSIISHSTEIHFEAGDTNELKIIADTVEKALADAETEEDLARLKVRFDDILVGHHSASLYVAEQQQGPIYVSPGPKLAKIISADNVELGNEATFRWDDAEHSYRVLIQIMDEDQPNGRQYTIAVAVPIDFHLQFLSAFRQTLWLTILASILLMGFIGWIAARRGHAPLHDIVDRIGQISANKLDQRLSPETMPNELTDLAVSFNDMLQRVDDAFQRLSDFSSDIAHELRTPVANMMTQAQVALTRSRTIEEYREILYSNVEEYERMAQMIGDMLYMAKADHGLQNNEITPVDFATEVRDLFDYYDGWAEERGVSMTVQGEACVMGDRGMLRRALSNLLSNAIRHTPSGENVHVTLCTSPSGKIGLTIKNPGAQIPSEHLPRLFNRFHRVDPARQQDGDGAGLGLAIVKSIINAHQGEIQVSSENGNTIFQISLPNLLPTNG